MIELPTEAEPVRVIQGDCLTALPRLPAESVDSCVTDPPYGLSFMGKDWDHGVPGVPFWESVGRVLKPGGYMLAMGGTRTYHRLACAVEDAGFEIRDCLMWIYGSGFPKGKGCLKPAYEPILLCRKPGSKVLELGVDECRVPTDGESLRAGGPNGGIGKRWRELEGRDDIPNIGRIAGSTSGRWPANVVHDGSDEVLEAFAAFGELKAAGGKANHEPSLSANGYGPGDSDGWKGNWHKSGDHYADTGTAARFFYCAKASREEREMGLDGIQKSEKYERQAVSRDFERMGSLTKPMRNHHPTVKPIALMRWLVKLVTPRDGIVLDPFLGSGSTLAAAQDWCYGIGIEREPAYVAIAQRRINEAMGRGVGSLFAEAV